MVLFREYLGDAIREARIQRNLTLRQVSSAARVSLGYISEVERGQKEASSELVLAICTALGIPLSLVLQQATNKIKAAEVTTPQNPEIRDAA